ncbi:Putative rRNA methylase [Megasphaera paucivorans]|uniref:Putative rRNA methylase n=1 Tax=Megasphaera paucivorans TaxID=349095 RepID=A0A1G9T0G2_9FIRM|nr:Putative rRNA methylase [Megasphaera paucivorans]
MMIETFPLKNAVTMAHALLLPYIPKAKVLVDMTCGNGHDTMFLAQHMNQSAQLYAFDIQSCAIEQTKKNMSGKDREYLHIIYGVGSHDQLVTQITEPLDVVVFNLGYLPAGDHAIYTQSATTINACKICLNKIAKNGIIMLAAYPGTPAGEEEQHALKKFLQHVPQKEYDVSYWQPLNQIHNPPILYIIQKRG